MEFVKITVDGIVYNLVKQSDGTWSITNRAPLSAGEYLMTVTITTDSGQEIEIDTTDEELVRALTLLVINGETISGNRMINYYPEVIKIITEFKALMFAEGFEVDFAKSDIDLIVYDAYLLTMDESRIAEWENKLGVTPSEGDSVEDRREVIIALIRGNGKLNTSLINTIVGTFTNGGTALSYIENSALYVKITPPVGNKQYKFENVYAAIAKKTPAHLGLIVTRNYATWGEIKNNFASWNTVDAMEDWNDVKIYIAPQ